MYFIVVGGGTVGYNLGKSLLKDGQEVLIIEQDPQTCQRITEELGSVAVRGDGCEAKTLEEVGAARADVLVAVTGDDEDNLVACQVARHKFKVPKTIARVKNPRLEPLFKLLGVDITVSSTNLILTHIQQGLPSHPLMPLLTLKGCLEVVEVCLPAVSPAVGKRLGELALPKGSVVCLLVGKDNLPVVPTKDTLLNAEDCLVAVTQTDSLAKLQAALAGL